jgi:hypothetical protein
MLLLLKISNCFVKVKLYINLMNVKKNQINE